MDYLGCYGHPWIETPAVDALAADAAVDDLTLRTVHAYFVARLAQRLNRRIDVDARTADQITFAVKPLTPI